jgi:hypothetical protein
MPKRILIIKIFIIFLFALHPNAWALDFQLGVGALDISKSDETSKESTFFPFVGLGGEMDSQLSVFLEVGTLGYEANVTGDEDLAKGSLNTTGTSTALIIAPQTENFVFRLGYGTILYKYNFEMDSGWDDIYELLGWDVTQKLDDANGTQIILGVDGKADPFFLGVEYRQISVKPKATIGIKIPSENIDLETTDEVDLSHTWMGIRFGLNF